MRPWNEIIAEARDRNKDYTLDEFCDVYERYYGPNEKLASGKTPSQKNKKKAKKFQQSGEMHGTETGPERADRMRNTFKGAVELRKTQKEKPKKEPYGPGNPSFDLSVKREKRKNKQLKFSIAQARKNAEEKKKQELENIKNKPRKAANAALSDIKTQSIAHKDSDATAYTKTVGNVGSLFGGIAKAGISYGIARDKAKKEAEAVQNAEVNKIPKKKPKKSGPLGGRPPAGPPNIKEKYFDWRDELLTEQGLIFEVDDKTDDKTEKKKIIDVMRGKNKIEINPNMKEEKDEEGGMAHNELATMERAVKTLRKKIKSPNQQLPAWVQSKISKAVDHIDSVADYMSGETEPVSEECGCEDDGKKVLAMMIIKKAVDAKKKKNSQLNSGIIGEESAAWQRKEGKNPEGGLNKKGIASYRRENPGSKLSLAVTTPPSKLDPDSKSAKRRKSFCARMGGMPGAMKDEKGRPTRKALSLRKWNC
jgi:hypothetical protein